MATQPSHELNKQPSCFVEGNQPGRPIKTIKDTDQLSCSVRRRRKRDQPISLKNQSPYFVNMEIANWYIQPSKHPKSQPVQ